MTPEQKAKELVDKYEKSFADIDEGSGYGYHNNSEANALIAVDEILALIEHIPFDADCQYIEPVITFSFWQEVKTKLLSLTL